MRYEVYKITNIINNKIYIGITTVGLDERWQQHLKAAFAPNSKSYNQVFKKAIRKYGEFSFLREVIDTANNIEELKQKEIYWIDFYHSCYLTGGWGYNGTLGGDKPTIPSKQKIYKVNIYTNVIEEIFDYGSEIEKKYHCDIWDIIYHKSSNSGWTECPINSGCTFVTEEEYKSFNENTLKSKFNVICQLDLQGKLIKYWIHLAEIERQLHISHGDISLCLNAKRQQAGGYQWCKFNELDKYLNKPIINLKSILKQKQVYQYDKQYNLLHIYNSLQEAAKAVQRSHSLLSRVCNNKNNKKSAAGYYWSYKPITTKEG